MPKPTPADTEALFNWRVALYLTADLRAAGATVVLTRTSDTGVGPCVTERAAIGNEVHANAAVSIHADGGPPGGRGFAILEPVADGINNAIIGPSAVLGADLRAAFAAGTGEPVSSYDGVDGIQPRDDLGGINLSIVPKVFIECANMRNAADAALVTSARWQVLAARAIAAGLPPSCSASRSACRTESDANPQCTRHVTGPGMTHVMAGRCGSALPAAGASWWYECTGEKGRHQ